MEPFDFNKHSSALKKRLRAVLRKHKTELAYSATVVNSQALKDIIKTLGLQVEQFADFVIRKQKEIDAMEPGVIKSKMQEHLDKIAVDTYEHLSKLTNKYQNMLNGDNDKGTIFNYSKN